MVRLRGVIGVSCQVKGFKGEQDPSEGVKQGVEW